ncbi:alpha-2-macroglobulin [Flavobacteriaceae bacterium F89]|uniref:Alpha-2-macroglobulin n=1 Tax=Cerina litoralis TaxID=2874477 RepID=A0AAE3JQ53_9FLAO|nr:MG2 domain-containing protein [Cerina litoralis]MCG2461746.1 alpha-2-macroglobulin [Cerina litoralis]
MKHLFTLLAILLFSQIAHSQQTDDSYQTLWKNVEKLEGEALTKSALEVVKTIFQKAEKENNSAQIVKSLLYTSKYALILEEDAQLTIVARFKKEIVKSEFPTKNVLESYLANLYWQYFQQNRYKFYNRTHTGSKIDSSDFRTWDLVALFDEINLHFANSLKNTAQLQKIDLQDYSEIIDRQKDSERYRPTLFDILAHTALEFYKSDENNITRPADKFEIDDPEYLCEASSFAALQIPLKDSTSLHARALQVYQELVRFHKNDHSPEPLVQVDLERLKFIHQNAVFTDKDHQYLEVLKNSGQHYRGKPVSGLYQYEIALLFNQWGSSYEPETQETNRWKRKKAVELCDSVIKNFPKSRGAEQCAALKLSILNPTLTIQSELNVPIQTPSRLLVNYKNYDRINFTAYSISKSQRQKLRKLYPEQKQLSFIKKLGISKQWEATLKNEKDYQNHGTEILLPSFANGYYIVLAEPETDDKFVIPGNAFAYSLLQVANMALVENSTDIADIFQVIDRNDGRPIAGAQVQFSFTKNHDGPILTKNLITDKMGQVRLTRTKDGWTNVSCEITFKGEKAQFGEYYVQQKYDRDKGTRIQFNSFLFTDRSIYRPGQPVYFKGILIQTEENKSEVVSGENVLVTLHDVNGQQLTKQDLTTNDFGSFTGEFILPNSGLTGQYYIEVSSVSGIVKRNYNFSVEEYKRPKFVTSFKPITETYRVNDSITVKGVAKAYAGSNITDAKVVYTVRRIVQFRPWFYWRHPYFNSSPLEISHGESLTDASGNYQIGFKAIPDASISKESQPVFTYEVTADVTDINGETHSATTNVRVGYHSLTAAIAVPANLNKKKKEQVLQITTTNLNGQFVPTTGTLKIFKVKAPDQVLRKRPWEAPDYPGWTMAVFKTLFPHDVYTNEDDPQHWEKAKMVKEINFDTGKSKEISLGSLQNWESGKYIVELEAKDKFGRTVADKAMTTVFGENDKKPADNQLFEIKTDKPSYHTGDEAKITVSTNVKHLTVTLIVEKEEKIVDTYLVNLNENSKSISVPISGEDLGGFSVNYSFSAFNDFQTGSTFINVPYPKTGLEIETVTFRNKLLPGTEERWSFKIKGPKGEKVASEVLASMYDASLDAFTIHNWNFSPLQRPRYYSHIYTNAQQSFGTGNFRVYNSIQRLGYPQQGYDQLDWFGFHFGYGRYQLMAARMKKNGIPSSVRSASEEIEFAEDSAVLNEAIITGDGNGPNNDTSQKAQDFSDIPIRKNLRETAFFFPQLRTDADGNVSFTFTSPEALTRWKLQLLAYTKNLESATNTWETVTQKELMVLPNVPRFLREGDEITIATKISNLTDKSLSGEAKLELLDAVSGKDITSVLIVSSPSGGARREFSVDSLGNTRVSWTLEIPKGLQAVQYKIMAKAGGFSDGEQNTLPVLTNRTLVTETLPMWVRSNQTNTFVLDKLASATLSHQATEGITTTLSNHKLTLEITSNPAWYAVQALPYLMEYPYECNEQTFARYFANSLASHIANSNPRIKAVFDQWANSDALISNLEKNPELKSLLIRETPWLRDAQSETEQKKRIGLLFNLDKMKSEQTIALNKLENNQMTNGAWPWFKGGPANRFITQHIITGLGHLNKLTATERSQSALSDQNGMTNRAIQYLDAQFLEEYQEMKKHARDLNDDHLSPTQIQYLYMRSFFLNIPTSKKVQEIINYYKSQSLKYWTKRNLYSKGMLALILYRIDETVTAYKILRSLKENSINSEELGMYWKENTPSWHWYQAPIETQALMVEAFSEIAKDTQAIDNLKIWLLKNKQTNQWETTKATTEAVYALLLQGSDWLSVTDAVDVVVGGEKIDLSKLEDVKPEAGTGYYRTSWNGSEITPKMGEVQLTKKGAGIAWGALYWQYFEDLDKITTAETPLKLEKKLFLKKNTDTGEEIIEIKPGTSLRVGDLVRVRIELRVDRPMEFVHMKDMRAAGFEPVNVLSQYKWQDGLGYYQSTKDAGTHFFFDYLPKGVFVFEYDLLANNSGDFSNGITTIQSMYAPEFNSHSEGIRVIVGNGQ